MSSLTELPPGQEAAATRRWWTRLRYFPLILLIVSSLVALVVGVTAGSRLVDEEVTPAATRAEAAPSPTDSLCRPTTTPAAQEPWLTADPSAQAIWDQHADEIAEKYVIGPNGWIFWSDYVEQYASQAVGKRYLSVSELNRWVDYYSAVRDGLAEDGIEFYIIVTPSTSSVYPEELPDWMQQVRGSTILDQFMAGSADLPVIDLRADLLAAKATTDYNMFSWSNSHWTEFGGYVGWTQIAPCVNAMFPDQTPLQVPPLDGVKITGDFNEWAPYGVESLGADWAVPVLGGGLQPVTLKDKDGVEAVVPGESVLDASRLPAETSVAASWTGKSALIMRDSMGGALSPYWAQGYSKTWQFYHEYGGFESFPHYRELAAEYKPDVVILQLAERHLIQVPPAGAGY
jgi:hypothetical protein